MDSLFEANNRENLASIWPIFSPTLQPVVEFYGHQRSRRNLFACFSNFYIHNEIPFTIPDCCWNLILTKCASIPQTIQVTFSEKSIMLCKAAAMGDIDSYRKIANSATPGEAKNLGRQVQNFDEGIWQSVLLTVAFEAVYQKFLGLTLSHRWEPNILLGTNDALIVEAAPGDFIWGIGYPRGHSYCQDPCRWGSGNVLGFALMKARHALVKTNIKQSEGGQTTGILVNVGVRNQVPVGMAPPGSAKKKHTGDGVSKNKKEHHHKQNKGRRRR